MTHVKLSAWLADAGEPLLVAIEEQVAPLPTARVDFPYRIAGKKAPDRAPVAIAHLVAEAESFGRRLAELGGVEPTRAGLSSLPEARVLELQKQLTDPAVGACT